jgi:hypothetical protein
VPNATVIVTNTSTGASQRVLTAPDGTFTMSGLAPGTYRVEIESAGFKRASQQNVELTVGSPSQISIALEAGDAATTVEAQGTTRTIQDESGEVSKALNSRVLSELPVIDRNHQELVGLLSGITPPTSPWPLAEDPQRNRAWNTNGQPHWSNNRKMDGVMNLEPVTGQAIHIMSQNAVRQKSVVSSNHEAQYGRAGGAHVTNYTRPGTNDFHGNLFYLHGNDQFGARNYFNAEPNPEAKYRSNQFGASVGGRIVRDRVFFFGDYEGDYHRQGMPRITTVPTAEFRAGNFSGIPDFTLFDPTTGTSAGMGRAMFNNNMIPAGRINPISRAIVNELPQPNLPGFINNYQTNQLWRSDGHRATGRLDFYLSEDTNLFLRHGYTNFLSAEGALFGDSAFGGGANSRLRNHNSVASLTHRFSPTFTADAAFGYTRYNNRLWGNGMADSGAFGLTGFSEFPNISIAGTDLLGNNPNFPARRVNNNYNFLANGGVTMGRHNLKFGVDIWHVRADGWQNLTFGSAGGFQFGPGATLSASGNGIGQFGPFASSFASFLLGAPERTGRSFAGLAPTLRTTEYAGYITDTFKATERLTLTFGLRYDVYSPVEARRLGDSDFFDNIGNTLAPGRDTVAWDTNNFGPRFGFAYRFADRTVLRGGYGISYFRPTLEWLGLPLMTTTSVERGVAGGFGTVSGGFAQIPEPAANTTPNGLQATLNDDIESPYIQSYSVQIQHDFGSGASFDIGYVGNLGRHLPYTRELNAAAPGMGVAGLPFAAAGRTASTLELGTGLTSNYNSLQANVSKRFTDTLALAGSYTFGKALDYGHGMAPFANNLDRAANYGPADWDRTHVFTLSHLWEPFGSGRRNGWIGALLQGWQLNGVLRAATGTPLDITADPLLCACPGNVARADVVQTGTVRRIIPTETFWGFFVGVPYRFPVFEFQQPAAGSFGNLGRNSVRADGFWNYDLALAKGFTIAEQNKFEIKGEVFNVMNTPHFVNPVTDINSVNFGQSLMTMPGMGPRTIRLGARYIF